MLSYKNICVYDEVTNLSDLLNRTINIVLKLIYKDEVIHTELAKLTIKETIIDSCTKLAFSLNNEIYKQKDEVSMQTPLVPVFATIIMTEFEKTIVKYLLDKSLIKVYMRLNLLMRAYNFNKNKITRSFMLIYFI